MPRPATIPSNARGEAVYAALQEKGISVTEAAKKARTPFNVIYGILHIPTYRPRAKTVERLAKRLGLDKAILLLGLAEVVEPAQEKSTTAPRKRGIRAPRAAS